MSAGFVVVEGKPTEGKLGIRSDVSHREFGFIRIALDRLHASIAVETHRLDYSMLGEGETCPKTPCDDPTSAFAADRDWY